MFSFFYVFNAALHIQYRTTLNYFSYNFATEIAILVFTKIGPLKNFNF